MLSCAAAVPYPSPARPAVGFALLTALLMLAAAGKAVLYDTLDPDLFLHLLAADQLQRDGVGPIVDGQSFASVRTPWTPYSWLAEFGMKAVWDLGGYRAALATHAALAALLLGAIAMACVATGRRVVDAGSAGEGEPPGEPRLTAARQEPRPTQDASGPL